MRYLPIFFALMTTAAMADGTFHNPEVVPLPAPPGEQVLLYPGGHYGRVVQYGLKQPGEDLAPIHLHRPTKHSHSLALHRPAHTPAAAVATAGPKTVRPKKAAAPHIAHHEIATAVPQKPAFSAPKLPPRPHPPTSRTATKQVMVNSPAHHAAPEVTKKAAPAKPVVKHVAEAKPQVTRVARAAPPKRHTRPAEPAAQYGLNQGAIPFQQSASQPTGAAIDQINALASSLRSKVTGRRRVQILAYAGPKGSKTSSARRLSLKRALIVRQLLIDGGVPSERIDVRAMGGITDNGTPERVDIFLKN